MATTILLQTQSRTFRKYRCLAQSLTNYPNIPYETWKLPSRRVSFSTSLLNLNNSMRRVQQKSSWYEERGIIKESQVLRWERYQSIWKAKLDSDWSWFLPWALRETFWITWPSGHSLQCGIRETFLALLLEKPEAAPELIGHAPMLGDPGLS